MSSVRSLYVYPLIPPVWVERIAVGSAEVSIPAADKMGNATVSEHFPKPEMSCMAAISFLMCLILHFLYFYINTTAGMREMLEAYFLRFCQPLQNKLILSTNNLF